MYSSMYSLYVFLSNIILIILHFPLFFSPDRRTVCIPVCILCMYSSLILYSSFFLFLCFSAQIEELYAFQYVFFVCIPLWYYTHHSSFFLCFSAQIEELYAFQYQSPDGTPKHLGWDMFDLQSEYMRQGVPNENWTITKLNRDYEVSVKIKGYFQTGTKKLVQNSTETMRPVLKPRAILREGLWN